MIVNVGRKGGNVLICWVGDSIQFPPKEWKEIVEKGNLAVSAIESEQKQQMVEMECPLCRRKPFAFNNCCLCGDDGKIFRPPTEEERVMQILMNLIKTHIIGIVKKPESDFDSFLKWKILNPDNETNIIKRILALEGEEPTP